MKDDKELLEQMIETDPLDFRNADEYFSKLSQLVRQHDRERLREAIKALFDSEAPIISEKDLFWTIDEVYKVEKP